MPFFGVDWRAPGDKWIRTELGWKRLSDVHASLRLQLTKVAAALPTKRSAGRRSPSLGASPRNNTRSSSRASSRVGSPLREKKSFNERRLQLLQFSLAQRCVSARTSSRESSHYATVSDAFNKLNFSQALLDTNCFPFICKVVGTLFEKYYWTLSGSMQTSLLRLTDTAKDIAIESRQHTGLTLRLIEKEKDILEKGRSKMATGFSVARLDSKIKTLISYRAQLNGEVHTDDGDVPPELPNDCWRHIIAYLTDPQDVLNLGRVNSQLCSVAAEEWVWRDLTHYHYNKSALTDNQSVNSWMDTFKETYISSRRQLKSVESHAVALCQLCHSVYWTSYGHPCSSATGNTQSQSTAAENTTELETRQLANTRITAQQFVQIFHC